MYIMVIQLQYPNQLFVHSRTSKDSGPGRMFHGIPGQGIIPICWDTMSH